MSCLRCLCLFACSGVWHLLCCVFVLFSVFRLMRPMLPVSLDCQYLVAPSVFSNVYLIVYCYGHTFCWHSEIFLTICHQQKNKTKSE